MDTLKVHTCMRHNNTAVTIIIHAMFYHSGAVILSPSGVAPVCIGNQLELMCTVTGDLLQWRFSVFRGNETSATEFTRTLTSTSSVMANLTVNSILFHFLRISTDDSMPLMSRLVISPVSNRLNGTVMNCEDVHGAEVSSTTICIGALQGIIIVYATRIMLYQLIWHYFSLREILPDWCTMT